MAAPPGSSVAVGDDCAAIADGDGFLLLAIEGLLDEFVSAEPWFAGYCAVMVNVSDVYAMGGRPLAVVDALWAAGADRAGPIWDGMKTAAAKYAVPIVGGHTNSRSDADHLAAAILGRASRLLTSFDARPGDALLAAIDLRGEWFGPYPWWNASTTADQTRLRGDLEILPALAEAGLCAAAKDISMGGLVGTAAMLAECSGIGISIDISTIPTPFVDPPPKSVLAHGRWASDNHTMIGKWLSAFPSYGFLLAVPPPNVPQVVSRFTERGIAVATIGMCDSSHQVTLSDGSGTIEVFWDMNREPFIGFGPGRPQEARP